MPAPAPVLRSTCGRLAIEVCHDRADLGRTAARACATYLRDVIARQREARVVFGCAPSQDEFLAALVDPRRTRVAVDWSKVTVFQLADYAGLPATAPQSLRHYLRTHLLDRVRIGRFHGLEADHPDRAAACERYAALLGAAPIDLICLDLGENGHLAFNDPLVADFEDKAIVKPVELDATCRQQQVNEGCFPDLDTVPRQALTLTLPVFRRARRLSVQTPGARKAPAVRATLHDAITTACPATVLRLHPHATLYLDPESAALAFSTGVLAAGARHASTP